MDDLGGNLGGNLGDDLIYIADLLEDAAAALTQHKDYLKHALEEEWRNGYRVGKKDALAQTEQEPVGWYDSISGEIDFTFYKPIRKPSSPSAEWIPVYTAPPKREWVGLTVDEIDKFMPYCHSEFDLAEFRTFASEIEAKLKERNT